jgi:hypothetical protein
MLDYEHPELTSANAPNIIVGERYVFRFEADSLFPMEWSVVGILPPGLAITRQGFLFGTPTQASNYVFTVIGSDGLGYVSREINMHVSRGEAFTLGDVRGTGHVTSADATALARYLIGENVTFHDWRAADLNRDGIISVADLTLLSRLLIGTFSTQ